MSSGDDPPVLSHGTDREHFGNKIVIELENSGDPLDDLTGTLDADAGTTTARDEPAIPLSVPRNRMNTWAQPHPGKPWKQDGRDGRQGVWWRSISSPINHSQRLPRSLQDLDGARHAVD